MPNWEEKWDDFSKKDSQDAINRDEQLNAACQQILDYVKSHKTEVEQLIQSSEGEQDHPWRSTETYSLSLEVEGHTLEWSVTYAMDQDGEEDDPEGEFYVDNQDLMYISWKDCPAAGELDNFLAYLAGV